MKFDLTTSNQIKYKMKTADIELDTLDANTIGQCHNRSTSQLIFTASKL